MSQLAVGVGARILVRRALRGFFNLTSCQLGSPAVGQEYIVWSGYLTQCVSLSRLSYANRGDSRWHFVQLPVKPVGSGQPSLVVMMRSTSGSL